MNIFTNSLIQKFQIIEAEMCDLDKVSQKSM